jgi:hypothetical protein
MIIVLSLSDFYYGTVMVTLSQSNINKYWTYALWLALFTIFYNFAEGLISVFFGFSDETLTLFGFGVDSFIEVMSGIGILYNEGKESFEKAAGMEDYCEEEEAERKA